MSANIRRSSKVSDSFYCFSDFRDQSTLLLAVCNVLSAERCPNINTWIAFAVKLFFKFDTPGGLTTS